MNWYFKISMTNYLKSIADKNVQITNINRQAQL